MGFALPIGLNRISWKRTTSASTLLSMGFFFPTDWVKSDELETLNMDAGTEKRTLLTLPIGLNRISWKLSSSFTKATLLCWGVPTDWVKSD